MKVSALRRVTTVIAAVAVLSTVGVARADHRPTQYCSESGDICQSVRKVNGVRRLRIVLAAEYFSNYRLCVRHPEGERECNNFEVHENDNGQWVGNVKWARHYTNWGFGRYNVLWKSADGSLEIGHKLGFHRNP